MHKSPVLWGVVSFCAGSALQLSDWKNIYVASALWLIAAALFVVAAFHWFRAKYQLIWPVRSRQLESAWVVPKSEWGISTQQQLTTKLRAYAGEHASVQVIFSHAQQRRLADDLISVFDMAGWRTHLTNVPLDKYIFDSKYFDGIEVRGYNKHLVSAVAELLSAAGLPGVELNLQELRVKRDNPKWASSNQSVRVTIGHRE